jgi:hypothetical protein
MPSPSATLLRRRSLSYSVDVLKKSAFQDELTNVLLLKLGANMMEDLERDVVIEYFKRRIKELDEKTKV